MKFIERLVGVQIGPDMEHRFRALGLRLTAEGLAIWAGTPLATIGLCRRLGPDGLVTMSLALLGGVAMGSFGVSLGLRWLFLPPRFQGED